MIEIREKNIDLTDQQKELIEKKVLKLLHLSEKLQDESIKIKVEVEHDPIKEKHKQLFIIVNIFAPGHTLRAEVHEERLRNALDICENKLRNQIGKIK